MANKKTLDEIKKDFKKIVEESPLPTVTLNEIDNKSDLKWKSLLLLSNKSINGPYRSLKLSYNKYNSEGVEVKRDDARKMAEAFIKFDVDNTELLFDEVEHKNDSLKPVQEKLESQTSQVDDAFKIMQFQFPVDDNRLVPNDGWINEIVTLMSKNNANLLFFIPPTFVDSVESVLQYQIAAFEANNKLVNPIRIAGYAPPNLSPRQTIQLEDIYIQSDINVIIYDNKGRRPNDSSLSHLIARSLLAKDNLIYIHGLNTNPGKKAMPFHSIFDLWLPSFGFQSVSNTRRLGGGSSDNQNKKKIDSRLTLPFRCVHGYYYPKYGYVHSKDFVCPKCNIQKIEDAFNEDAKIKVHRACTQHNAEESSKELAEIGKRIKEESLRNYLLKKEGLKPIEYSNQLERFEKTVKHEKQKLSIKKLDEWF
jgi:hypothetical protein